MKRIVIIGATSGRGKEVALAYIKQGWKTGIAGRRETALTELQSISPERVETETIDITREDAPVKINNLIEKTGGMDILLLCSGIGSQNPMLNLDIELNTAKTNVEGFIRVITTAFGYFRQKGRGHIAVISSIAGTKGLGIAAAYSATKRFQNTYIEALSQLSRMEKLNISFTDIRPGFVATDLLKGEKYPMLMNPRKVAEHIVHALDRKKRIVIIDRRYRLLVFFWKLIPRRIWERLPVKNG